jgi:hypothetical protein
LTSKDLEQSMDGTPSVEVLGLDDARRLAKLVGTLNESKQIKKTSYSMSRMLTWQGVPPKLVKQLDREAIQASRSALSQKYMSKMQDLFTKAKEVGKAAVSHDLRQLVHGTFQQARELGYQAMGRITDLDKFDKAIISRAAEEELKYANGFLDDYMNDRGKMPYDQRFDQYRNTVTHQFNMAASQSVPADTLIWWEMTSMEPCPDCPVLAADSPYTGDLGNNPLPTVPQAGDTQCCGNCRCYLRYEWPGFHIGTEPDMSYEVDELEGEPVSADWFSTKVGRQVQQDLNSMYRREAYHRQMMDAYGHGTSEWRQHKELRDKWSSKLKAYKSQHGIRAVPRSNVSDYLAPVDDLLSKGFRVLTEPSTYKGEAALLRGLRLTPGEVVNISKSSVRMKLVNGKEKVFSYGDDAGASLWTRENIRLQQVIADRKASMLKKLPTGSAAEKAILKDKIASNFASNLVVKNGKSTAKDLEQIYEGFKHVEMQTKVFSSYGKLRELTVDYSGRSTSSGIYYRGKRMELFPKIERNLQYDTKALQAERGYSYVSCPGLAGTARHEVGHMFKDCAIDRGILNETQVYDAMKKSVAEWGEKRIVLDISKYSMTSSEEFFAECFSIRSSISYNPAQLPGPIRELMDKLIAGGK